MTLPISVVTSSTPVASLGLSHGYCFEGDLTHLNADLVAHDPESASAMAWALQLWASHNSENPTPDNGVKIAEIHIGSPFDNGQLFAQTQGTANALTPAGGTPYTLFLVLASGNEGEFNTLHDFAIYPKPEVFVQPRLHGAIDYTLSDSSLQLKIEAIENPRTEENLSGTLALELWSLDSRYHGGEWSGSPISSLILGTLAGQCQWSDCEYQANAAAAEQTGFLTLMLREWTSAGYVTRDFRILAEPATKAVAAPKAKAPKKPAAPKSEKAAPPKKAVEVVPEKAAPKGVSVNKGTEADLIAVKGLSTAVARAIIAGRPFATLDDLCRVKGMGSKLLSKIKDLLTL